MTDTTEILPRWDLSNVYPGLESTEYKAAFQEAASLVDKVGLYLEEQDINRTAGSETGDLAETNKQTADLVNLFTSAFTQVYTLRNYVYSFMSTDSYDNLARRQYFMVEALIVRLLQYEKVAQGWLGSLGSHLDEVIRSNPVAEAHAFYLRESAEQSRYLMSDDEENLANQLSLSSLRAWEKLQGTLTSQLTIELDMDGQVEKYPLPALQNIRRYNPDPAVRQRAFEAEIAGLKSIQEPLAACLNGVTGFNIALNQARGREDALHHALDTARIDRQILEVMLGAMQAAFPTFRGYMHTKARRFGEDALPWWDVFAPVSQDTPSFTWSQGKEFVLDNFATFSPDLASFAQHAFDHNWIDAEPRDGKRGGAFCIRIPAVEEPRVLCNFDGSLDQVSTIAHELGHAYHIYCQRGKDILQFTTPMTLAETASIFCETLIMNAALENTSSPQEELAILETILISNTQVIVDISSRFLFEKEIYQRREESELSAGEFCEIITAKQVETYGDGLNEAHLHAYMWAWKPHYYRSDIAFYNFPYAFGLLFSTGLYAIYQERGRDFVPQFKDLLANTGQANAADLAARFEIDIRSPEFWQDSLEIIKQQVKRYQGL